MGALKGEIPWNKGLTVKTDVRVEKSCQHKLDCRCCFCKAKRGEFKDKNHPQYGKHLSKKTKKKISIAQKKQIALNGHSRGMLGKKHSKKTIETIQQRSSGKNNAMYGRHHSKVTKEKMKERKIGMYIGKNNSNWNGGKSFELYSEKFNYYLKSKIRKRDNYQCQFCGVKENGRAFCPHHINYNKKSNNERNLLLLCNSHNVKANFQREKWQFLFETLQEIRSHSINLTT